MRVCKEDYFSEFDLIDDSNTFIILFEAVDTVIDSIENFHRKNIGQDTFLDLNPFCRMVIH